MKGGKVLHRSNITPQLPRQLTKIKQSVNLPTPTDNPKPSKSRKLISSLPDTYAKGTLGKSDRQAARLLAQLGWHTFMRYHQQPLAISSSLHTLAHPLHPIYHVSLNTGSHSSLSLHRGTPCSSLMPSIMAHTHLPHINSLTSFYKICRATLTWAIGLSSLSLMSSTYLFSSWHRQGSYLNATDNPFQ
jgi:hypothetical protein